MNVWLIVGRCTMDDIPLGIEADEVKARQLAQILMEKDVIKAAEGLTEKLKPENVVNIAIMEFKNRRPKGKYIVVKEF